MNDLIKTSRLKYLEEESDALKEEYDRYVRKNYKQTPQVANKTSAGIPASHTCLSDTAVSKAKLLSTSSKLFRLRTCSIFLKA